MWTKKSKSKLFEPVEGKATSPQEAEVGQAPVLVQGEDKEITPRTEEANQAEVLQQDEHEEHEERPRVTGLELFFDLAFVVMINRVAKPLEHHPVIFYRHVQHSFLAMQAVYLLWCSTVEYIIRARLATGRIMVIRTFDVAVIVAVMLCASYMALACKAHSDTKFILAFLAAMMVPSLAFQVLPFRGDFSRQDACLASIAFPWMAAFFVPPLIWQDPNRLVWSFCGLGHQLLGILVNFFIVFDEKDATSEEYLDELHEERWELITLIAMGETLQHS